ncbi:hypothetical protein Y032_0036g3257 [Ancylostoma ceylanicum]|nr:hypothetical protein Y032_0036g3257 [Ancylostoma ceylanicum]
MHRRRGAAQQMAAWGEDFFKRLQGTTSFRMLEIATYLGPSRHVNPSNVHQQEQKRRNPRSQRVEVAKIWSWEVDRSKLCWLPAKAATLANES